ncbi:MAG: TetR/AcrR family transcriptional regulator [Oscillatoriales cyanobacterium]|uniref:TetR/AcrR family transcriptional regulator n=1 Tax=Microcoleus anatoxicus PTRS2 TaxID=2705321 RepID=A0ABU8YHN2_9CYAN|nr:MAG: TetR/AcrR family transcriptional regulator [Oscillatoriales cyanobacterium]TAD93565.1 MAG: TetR/AcrR family transcriptional regulator [Oscillatoriales cyanobacterium]TAE03795.1 MAG: TetR/AcrR family transcriptional regulator [Oscillatoriales cyanobacterium]TAF70345.1 MAG: TetR/AcrR family transcriptional regulator [Oscillatoriales cyanobacterium]
MSKAQETREKILREAAALFNQYGYSGSSMSDIMRVTGLQKGGIYNHFKSKDELALQAFDFAAECMRKQYLTALKGKHNSVDQLKAVISLFSTFAENPPIPGGCPLLNTAVESDDAHPALRQRVQIAMDGWRALICKIINKGIAKGEVRENVEADAVATIVISTLEGAVMMSKLYGDAIHVKRVVAHLHEYLDSQL